MVSIVLFTIFWLEKAPKFGGEGAKLLKVKRLFENEFYQALKLGFC